MSSAMQASYAKVIPPCYRASILILLWYQTKSEARTLDEEWRAVVGYEGVYEVSSWGRVRRVLTRTAGRSGHVLRAWVGKNGYCYVHLFDCQRRRKSTVHRLVAQSFLAPIDGAPIVNHKDGRKTNNHVENLEYVSAQGNVRHALDTGLTVPKRGEESSDHKLTWDAVRSIRARYIPRDREHGQRAIARDYGVQHCTIAKVLHGKTWIDGDWTTVTVEN